MAVRRNRINLGIFDNRVEDSSGRQLLSERHRVYKEAKKRMPNRWSGSSRNWKPVEIVWLNPEKSADNATIMLQAA